MRMGFTLIELSIGLTILSLMAAGALTVGSVMVEQQQFTGSNERVNEAKQVLVDYFAINGRLPCPASRTAQPGSGTFGTEAPCTSGGAAPAGTARVNSSGAFSGAAYSPGVIRIGALPVRTLGMPDAFMADEYGNRLLYAMTERFADSSLIDDSATLGAITVQDGNSNAITNASTTSGAVFIVFSAGPDGKGANRYSTGTVPVGCTGGLDEENCDGDIIFRDTRFNNGKNAASFFDDMLTWSPKYLLTSSADTLKAAGSHGQVQYNNNKLLGANANFFWDITNARLGIGTSTPPTQLSLSHASGNAYFDIRAPLSQQSAIAFSDHTNGQSWVLYRYQGTRDLSLWNASTHTVMHFSYANGNIGVNASPDTNKFTVYANVNSAYAGNFYNNGTHGLAGNGGDYGVVGTARNSSGVGVHAVNNSSGIYTHLANAGWGVYTNGNSFASGSNYINGQHFIQNSSPTVYFQDTDHRSAMLHVNSERFYVLRGNGVNSQAYETYNGYWPLEIRLANNDAIFGGNIYVPAGNFIGAPSCRQVVGPSTTGASRAQCASNEYLMSGGGWCNFTNNDFIHLNMPDYGANSWLTDCYSSNYNDSIANAVAICCRRS